MFETDQEWEAFIQERRSEAMAQYEQKAALARQQATSNYNAAENPVGTLQDWIDLRVAMFDAPPTLDELRHMYEFMRPQVSPVPQEAEAPRTLAGLKAAKLVELQAAFHTACQHAVVQSSLGFLMDADETANRNVEGLVARLEATGEERVMFCDADNNMHPVSLANLRTMRLEIISRGQDMYAAKWLLRSAIESADSEQALAQVNINALLA